MTLDKNCRRFVPCFRFFLLPFRFNHPIKKCPEFQVSAITLNNVYYRELHSPRVSLHSRARHLIRLVTTRIADLTVYILSVSGSFHAFHVSIVHEPASVRSHNLSSVPKPVPYPAAVRLLMQLWLSALVLVLLTSCAKWNEPRRTDHVSGTIEVDEAQLASRYGGRVQQIFVRESDSLSAGQKIIQLEASELTARRKQAMALLDELKAGARKEELATARSEWQAAVAELEFARAEARRITQLFEEKAIAEAERDRALTRAASLERSVDAAKSRFELLAAGTRVERIAQAEAQLAEIDSNLRETTVIAPTNSVLEVLHVKVGDVAAPNRPLATLLLTNAMWVRVYIPEPWLGHIRLGEEVRVRVDSFPERDFNGEVEQIARAAEFTPRNVQTVEDRVKQVFGVKVRLQSPDLRAGMAADVFFRSTPKGE